MSLEFPNEFRDSRVNSWIPNGLLQTTELSSIQLTKLVDDLNDVETNELLHSLNLDQQQ